MIFTAKEQLEPRKIVKNISALVFLVLLSAGMANGQAGPGDEFFEKLGFNILRAKTTGGFLEYEFFPDGKLISYEYIREGTDSGPDIIDNSFLPKFRVEFLQWNIEGKNIYIYHGNRRSMSELRNDEKYVYFNELVWLKVKRLEFFGELSKFTGKAIVLESLEKNGKEVPSKAP